MRLRSTLRPTDTISRFAGWRFAVLAEEISQPQDADLIIGRLHKNLTEPYQIAEQNLQIEITYGFSVYNPSIQTPQDMVDAAQAALQPRIT